MLHGALFGTLGLIGSQHMPGVSSLCLNFASQMLVQFECKAEHLFVLTKPTLAAAVMRQRAVQAGAASCHPPTAPRQKERTRGWRGWVWVRQLPADAGLVQQIPYHQYFLQLGSGFWPEVLHILADSSCCNSFVLLTTRCFVLCSGNSLPNSHHGAGRAQRWLRGQGRMC